MIDKVLIVDDEFLIRQLMEETITRRGIEVVTASSGEEAVKEIEKNDFQIIFSDMKMGKMDGIELLKHCRKKIPSAFFIIMTAYGTIDTAVNAMNLGAFDFIIKPFPPDQTDVIIEKARYWYQLNEQKNFLQKELTNTPELSKKTIGSSKKIKSIANLIKRVAKTDATVLISGESGTGKELIASEIQAISNPANEKPYIKMNCAAVPENLLESELFGHEKGAFTGAAERRIGRFELADGGTLLLDEISEISTAMQAKLLRILQESEFERIGGTKTLSINVRVIATTNRNLKDEVSKGKFREDLFYRLNVFPIHLSPLREREKDSQQIAKHFLEKQSEKLKRELHFSDDALERISNYSWPGNIRELENIVERISILEDGPTITSDALPKELITGVHNQSDSYIIDKIFKISEIERNTIKRALRETAGNKSKAADLLGFTARTLRNKLNEYKEKGLFDSEFLSLIGKGD